MAYGTISGQTWANRTNNIQLLDGSDKSISNVGWYRIAQMPMGVSDFIVNLSNSYNTEGSEHALIKVTADQYCPSIVVLSHSTRNANRYKQMRITYNTSTKLYAVDLYYSPRSSSAANSVRSSFIQMSMFQNALLQPVNFNLISSLAANESVILTQDLGIVPSGSVLTTGTVLPSNVQIQTGSYVGTGSFGMSNPTIINTNFTPKMVCITSAGEVGNSCTINWIYNNSKGFMLYSGSGNSSWDNLTWLSTGLSWYSQQSPTMQLNGANVTYYWVAIG